jgi:hypothetical protein
MPAFAGRAAPKIFYVCSVNAGNGIVAGNVLPITAGKEFVITSRTSNRNRL